MANTEKFDIYYLGEEDYPRKADVPTATKEIATSIENSLEKNVSEPIQTINSTLGEINTKIDGKVSNEAGKGLSSNDFTDEEKLKLQAIEDEAQVNKIEAIKVNGKVQPIFDKVVDLKLDDAGSGTDLSVKYGTFLGILANIRNSAEAYMKSFSIEGVIEQENRESYNLLNITKIDSTLTYGGVTATITEDGVLLNGTATSTVIFVLTDNILYQAGEYRLSGCPAGGSDTTYRMDYSENNSVIANRLDTGEGTNISLTTETNIIPRIRVQTGTVCDNLLFKPMITKGTEIKPFVPYGGIPSITNPSEVCGLGDNYNLLPVTVKLPATVNGITYIKGENNSIIVNGTATENSTLYFCNAANGIDCKAGKYRLSGCPAGGAELTYRLDIVDNISTPVLDLGSGANFEIPTNGRVVPRIRVQKGVTVNNLIFKPMIIEGTEEKPYIPYKSAVVKIGNEDDSKNQEYQLNFGDLILYRDEIPYVEDNKVYYDKKWHKHIFTGDDNIMFQSISAGKHRILLLSEKNPNIPIPISVNTDKTEDIFCNIAKKVSANNTWDGIQGISYRLSDSPGFTICLKDFQTEQEYRDALRNNYMVYQLATPVKTEITGELAEQIKNLYENIQTYKGSTDIELLGYGKINGEYLINTEFANKLSEINDITNIGLAKKIDEVEQKIENSGQSIDIGAIKELISNSILEDNEKKHPIGTLEFNVSGKNPFEYLGFGEWIQWGAGRVPVGFDANDTDFNKSEKTGGSKTATLEANNIPYHTHRYTAIKSIEGTILTAKQCALKEHSHLTVGLPSSTGSTTLTASQSGLPKHKHRLIKGYYTYNASSSGSINSTGVGTEFISASSTETTEVGGTNASEGHTHTITGQATQTDGAGTANSQEKHTHEFTMQTLSTFYDDNIDVNDSPYAFDIQQKYIVCFMWKRIS